MSENLTVFTLTRGNRQQWFTECCQSVAAKMPVGGAHHVEVSQPEDDFQSVRYHSTKKLGGYVAWVDDDDRVVNDALRLCVDALDATGAGIAFTSERRIDALGNPLPAAGQGPRTRRDIAMHPQQLHHLAVVRTDCLNPLVLWHAKRIGIGIDWLMRAYVALNHGAVQVPIIGYEWRHHAGQESVSEAWDNLYEQKMHDLRCVTNSWLVADEPIQIFDRSCSFTPG